MTFAAAIKRRSKLTNRAIEAALGIGTGDGSLFGKYLKGRRTMERKQVEKLAKKAHGPGPSGGPRKWVTPLIKLKLLKPCSAQHAHNAEMDRLLIEASERQQRAMTRQLKRTFRELERAQEVLEALDSHRGELREGLRQSGWKESTLGRIGAQIAELHASYLALLPRGVSFPGVRAAKK